MREYGQIVDDFGTPSGRYIVVWDLAARESWYGLVQGHFKGVIGTLVAFERSDDGKSVSIATIDPSDLPGTVSPAISPPSEPHASTGGAASNLLLVHAHA
jgi:hypothetical protein